LIYQAMAGSILDAYLHFQAQRQNWTMLPLQGDRGYHATSAGASCDESTCQPRP